jgi:hypothetical protein
MLLGCALALAPNASASKPVRMPAPIGTGDTQTGRTYLFTGDFRATMDPSGTITAFTSAGTSQDVCAMLM